MKSCSTTKHYSTTTPQYCWLLSPKRRVAVARQNRSATWLTWRVSRDVIYETPSCRTSSRPPHSFKLFIYLESIVFALLLTLTTMEDPVILAQSTEQSSNSTRDSSVPPAPPMSQSQSQTRPDEIQESVRTSIEDVWYLKEIWFPGGENGQMRPYKIITQNFNG